MVLAIGANIVFKLGMVLMVGGRSLFARCAGPMAAVEVGLVVALMLTKRTALCATSVKMTRQLPSPLPGPESQMEAERLNAIEKQLEDLGTRTKELRRYL